ncbi:MAG: hypothetical protein Q8O67_10640 [Deltaproteobacteria bacterium]|nr:hypothetical protein [Deltaproteobacteria bacterium]
MLLSLVLSLAAGGDVAVVVRRANADPVALQARCALHVPCASLEHVDAALKDASSLGIRCNVDDADCWRRFLAAESDLGSVVVVGDDAMIAISMSRVDMRALPPGVDPLAAIDALLAPAVEPLQPPLTEAPIVAPPPPPPPSTPLLLVAGGAGVGALLAGAASVVVSVQLANDLDAAERGELPLVDYAVRDGAVTALGITAGVLGAAAVVVAVVATLE